MGRKSSRYESPNRLRVRKNRRVKMHYRVCLASGEEFDASAPDSPLEIVCGRGETILGLEKRILGMQPGDEREFIIPPEEAFGVHDAVTNSGVQTIFSTSTAFAALKTDGSVQAWGDQTFGGTDPGITSSVETSC